MSLPKNNHILITPTKKTQKKTQKDPKNPRSNHEIPKSKIGEIETEESKKQKRESIQKKERVPLAWWATNSVDNELQYGKRLPS